MDLLATYKASLATCRTAKLWLQYIDMIILLKKLIKAERLGNWFLHLQNVSEILPFLAASRHNLYAKSARLYLQHMTELESTHPDVFKTTEMVSMWPGEVGDFWQVYQRTL